MISTTPEFEKRFCKFCKKLKAKHTKNSTKYPFKLIFMEIWINRFYTIDDIFAMFFISSVTNAMDSQLLCLEPIRSNAFVMMFFWEQNESDIEYP